MPNVFITGANRGLGLEFARQYAQAGWQVIASCRQPDQAVELRSLGVEVVALDVGDFAAIADLAERFRGRGFDLVLNNAGRLGGDQQFGRIDRDGWLDELRVNAMAPILIAEALLPNLLAGGQRRLVFLTSQMGSIGDNRGGGYYAYRTSKAALNAGVKSLSIDLAGHGISTLLLHPGWAKTAMGGPHATIAVADAVTGMRTLIEQMRPGQAVRFLDYRGQSLPW